MVLWYLCTRLLLQQSEFESRWSLQFFFPVKLLETNKNKQKEAGNAPKVWFMIAPLISITVAQVHFHTAEVGTALGTHFHWEDNK